MKMPATSVCLFVKAWCLFLGLFCVAGASARTGRVETTDGVARAGEVQLTGGLVQIHEPNGKTTQVQLSNVVALRLDATSRDPALTPEVLTHGVLASYFSDTELARPVLTRLED